MEILALPFGSIEGPAGKSRRKDEARVRLQTGFALACRPGTLLLLRGGLLKQFQG
jgi:hypothetical protein